MNYTVTSGRICTVPSVAILPLKVNEDVKQLFVCKFTVAVPEYGSGKKEYNFFECIAFEQTARKINSAFSKGAKIILMSKLVNHKFKDANNTSHFTNILLVEHVEFGDTESGINRINLDTKLPDFSVFSDLEQMEKAFSTVCEQGFLCINEDDYYNIASSNLDFA